MNKKLEELVLKEDTEKIVLNDLRESLKILKDIFKIEQRYIDTAYENCSAITDYTLNYFKIHRTEYEKVARIMLYIHSEYFKWCCNDFAEDIAFSKLQKKEPEEIYDDDEEISQTYKFEIYTLDEPSIIHIHNELFKGIKPDMVV